VATLVELGGKRPQVDASVRARPQLTRGRYPGRCSVIEHPGRGGCPAVRVDYHAKRLVSSESAVRQSRREVRVVREDR